jgi:outer membrane protein assembly factor BamD (BamD/ComL family)
MKRITQISFLVVVLFSMLQACKKDPKAEQIKAIGRLETELYSAQTIDKAKGMHIIDTYVGFSKQYPEDTLSAAYLFKAGEIAMNLQLGSQAIFYYDKLTHNYPEYFKAPESMFLKAFIYENQLGDLNKAEQLYKQFIEMYPKHQLADDAKASLEYLGKSPEELVKMFQEKNKQE